MRVCMFEKITERNNPNNLIHIRSCVDEKMNQHNYCWIFVDRMPVHGEIGGDPIVHYNHLGKKLELVLETKETVLATQHAFRKDVDAVIGSLPETRKRPALAYAVQERTKKIVRDFIRKKF